MPRIATSNTKDAIISIGQELIRRAEDISKDLKRVSSITIHAELNPNEIVNFDVTKNYFTEFKEGENQNGKTNIN